MAPVLHACVVYFWENDNLNVLLKFVTADGIRLGVWMNNVRGSYNGKGNSYRLTQEQIKTLDDVGMLCNKRYDRLWAKGYEEAMKYCGEYGNLDVLVPFRTENGYRLGASFCAQRVNSRLSDLRRKRLDDLGMIWSRPDPRELCYALTEAYYEGHDV